MDPQRVVERKQNYQQMKSKNVRQWAKELSKIFDRKRRHNFLLQVPEEYRDAVEHLSRSWK